jgi:kumamolisin
MSQVREGYHAVDQSECKPAIGASRVGLADPKEVLSVSIRIRRRPDAAAPDLDRYTAAPHAQRKYLSREEFADQHGAAQADVDHIHAFAKAHGLKVAETSLARRTVVLTGTVDKMNHAFGVELHHYQTKDQIYRGHEGSVVVPDTLAAIVEAVHGLDNRQVAVPLFRVAAAPQGVTPLTPPQVGKLYDFPNVSASGQTIGILEFGGGFKPADITNYFENVVKLPVPTVVTVGVDGAGNSPGSDADLEVILDIDVAGSVAPGAKIVVYFAPNSVQGFVDAITTAVHDAVNRPSVISISWAGGESGWGSAINSVSSALREAAAVGVTVYVSSGDSGSNNPAEVLYPSSDPGVVGCGGTTIENVSGTSFSEVVWGGSGGGISNVFARPYWQSWAGVPPSVNPPGHIGRGVPDVAGNADPNSGYMLIQNGSQIGPIGGTSAVAPLYAGLTALLNASLGEPVGYLNYNIYALAGPYVYRDIVSGSNGLYNAAPGWDACTGFGSIDGDAMVNSLWGVGLPPALATLNNKLYMAWKGIERDDRIFYTSFNGSNWAPQQLIPNIATSSGVALAEFNGKLYMAWKGMEDDQGIYWSEFNGSNWAPQQQVANVGTSTGPRLAVFQGKLYMAWKGLEGDQRLWWSSSNGTTWAPQQEIPGVASSVGPALAVYNNALYAVWKGMYGDQGIWYSHFDGSTWAPQKLMAGVGTSEGPSLAVYNNRLYAAWKGMLGDQRLWQSNFNGLVWTPQQMIPGVASSVGPGLCVYGTNLYATWKGMLGDQRIWYSHFNGSTWAPQQIVPGVGSSPDLIAEIKVKEGEADTEVPAAIIAGRADGKQAPPTAQP